MDRRPCPNVSGMRRTPRLVAPALLAALVLTGCLPSGPAATPPPTPDAEPVFASDEEALAAAEEAYSKYLATVDTILADGGSSPERLKPLVAGEIYELELGGFETFVANGWRGTGSTGFEMSLQQYSDLEVLAYACEDISATDVLDQEGRSVVPADRPVHYAFEVGFVVVAGALILETKEPWDGGGVCIQP